MPSVPLSFCLLNRRASIAPAQTSFIQTIGDPLFLVNKAVMRIVFSVAVIFIFAIVAAAQAQRGMDLSNYGVRIEPDKRLMVVLAALEMASTRSDAGVETRLINTPLSDAGTNFRQKLRTDLADIPPDLKQKISTFVAQYKKRHPKGTDAQIIAPFVSMAYALTPVPELQDPVVTADLPGELLDVLDFAPLVREFYRRSSIAGRLNDYVKLYVQESEAVLRPTAKDMVSDLLDYLHTRPETSYIQQVKTQTQKSKRTTLQKVETVEHDRRFYIVPELLAPVGNITFLNIHDDYFVIMPPNTNLAYSEARRAFLQYVIDAIALTNSKDIFSQKDGIKALLDERRKINPDVSPDVYLAVTRSLIAAADARQQEFSKSQIATQQARTKIDFLKTTAEKQAVSAELQKYKDSLADETALRLSEEYEKGSVLAFYFADQLKGTENSGFDIASSMRDMILAFDATKETGRLAQFAEARKRAVAARVERKNNPDSILGITENPVTKRLLEIQEMIKAKNYVQADADLKLLQKTNPSEPRIFYNIGRVASLSTEGITDPEAQAKKLLEAKTAYENALHTATTETDPALISLTYVALAKIYEFYDQKDYALKIYNAAIQLGDVTNGGFKEAIAAKQRLLKTP